MTMTFFAEMHTQQQTYHRVERRMLPIPHLDPLYSTRLLVSTTKTDCDSSSLLPQDSRQEIDHHRYMMKVTTFDTASQSRSYSLFPCTHVPLQFLCTLPK